MYKYLTILSLLILSFDKLNAQDAENPIQWKVSIEKTEKSNEYLLHATGLIAEGYHIWHLEAGGDGSLINTEIEMDDPHGYVWKEEKWETDQKPIPVDLDYIEGTLFWHEKQVDIKRTLISDNSIPVEGKIIFQVCNEQYCYPPEESIFKLNIPID